MDRPEIIVLFDGVCNLCNAAVDFVIRRDPQGRIHFASQQSDAGQALLRKLDCEQVDGASIVAIHGDRVFLRSRAALEITRRLRHLWPMLYAFIVVPSCLRDPLYRWIARNRYRWFGKRDTCRVPSESEKARFVE